MGKLKLSEFKYCTYDHSANKNKSKDLNPDLWELIGEVLSSIRLLRDSNTDVLKKYISSCCNMG